MSAKPETTFIASIHKYLPQSVYRMKNHNPYVGGVPDVWYSGPTGDLWVEYKFIVLPKRPDTPIVLTGAKGLLSALQQKWLRDRHEEGRNVAVCVGWKEGGVWLPDDNWSRYAYTAESFTEQMLSRADLATSICQYTG